MSKKIQTILAIIVLSLGLIGAGYGGFCYIAPMTRLVALEVRVDLKTLNDQIFELESRIDRIQSKVYLSDEDKDMLIYLRKQLKWMEEQKLELMTGQ